MSIIFASQALVGENLQLERNLYIMIDEKGIITAISKERLGDVDYTIPPSSILLPGFINAHTHVADSFAKDQGFGLKLDEVVGSDGIKHRLLQSSSFTDLVRGMRNSLEILVLNGYTSFIDFREGGPKGCLMLKDVLSSFPLRGVILGRPYKTYTVKDLHLIADGVGFSDIFAMNKERIGDEIKELKDQDANFLVSLHVSETQDVISSSLSSFGKTDIQYALDLITVDFVIHANYADVEKDLPLLKEKNVGVICCPLTATYFNLKFPPIKELLDYDILLGLGTDNTMITNPDPFFLMRYTIFMISYLGYKVDPLEILKAVTVNPGIIVKKNIGQIKEGYSADFVAIDLNSPRTLYSKDFITAITLRATPMDITFQMFKGERIK
ncbi:MAG: amidohydrolase family protein [Candidatus Heimdallarchaeaceae archaeon]